MAKIENLRSLSAKNRFVDEISDEIVDSILNTDLKYDISRSLGEGGGSWDRIDNIGNRINGLEQRFDTIMNNFKVVGADTDTSTEESRDIIRKNEEMILNLKGEIENLKTAIIRLDNKLDRGLKQRDF